MSLDKYQLRWIISELFWISFGALWTDITQANSAGSQTIETKKPENLSSWEWVDRPQSLFDSYLKKMNFTTKLDWLGVGHKLVNLHVNLTLRHLALLHQREREEVQKERWIWNDFKRSIRLSRIVLGTLPPYHFQNLNQSSFQASISSSYPNLIPGRLSAICNMQYHACI